jgi:Family of unknown function (DUF6152)
MKKTAATFLGGALIIVMASSLAAHHSLSQFDTTTAVRVKGPISRVELVNPHSIIFVDQKGVDGQPQRWAVEGPGVVQLARSGFNKESLKVGEIIEACGYVTKEGVDPQQTLSKLPANPKNASVRLMDAELLVMPDGQIQKWSDYGQHLCLGADYHDFHK